MTAISPLAMVDENILIEKDLPIPLIDGHLLYCNVFRPNNSSGGLAFRKVPSTRAILLCPTPRKDARRRSLDEAAATCPPV
jgi:predicted acyl esterase